MEEFEKLAWTVEMLENEVEARRQNLVAMDAYFAAVMEGNFYT